MPVDWKAPDSYNRLLAALYASMDGNTKLNYKRIADFYGEGATYDAIEGRFRIIKKQAEKLKEEVANGRPIAPARGANKSAESTPRKPKTPRNNASHEGVISGRVTKLNSNSPTKRKQTRGDPTDNSASTSASSISGAEVETPSSSGGMNETSVFETDCSFYGTSFDQSFNMPMQPPVFDPHGMMQPSYEWNIDSEHAV